MSDETTIKTGPFGFRSVLALAAVLFVFGCSDVLAQCNNGCQGRCQYCVEGQCRPKNGTWGHYQTSWRRWPEPAQPAAPCPAAEAGGKDVRKDNSAPDLELPIPEEETEGNPEFPHLRQKADLFIPSEMPMNEYMPNNDYVPGEDYGSESGDLIESEIPSGMMDAQPDTGNPFGDGDEMLDLPGAEFEGSSSRNQVRPEREPLQRPSQSTYFRPQPAPSETRASVSSGFVNPLRRQTQATAPVPMRMPAQVTRPVSYSAEAKLPNPLR